MAVKVIVKVVVVVTAAAAVVVETMDIVVEKVMVVVGRQVVTWLNSFFLLKSFEPTLNKSCDRC